MKKKIFMLSLVACLVVLSIAGTSLAYFSDIDSKTNVFTAGNVDITLDYVSTTTENPTKLYPGQTYTNPAKITNTGSEDAYVGLVIDIPQQFGYSLNIVETIFSVTGCDSVAYYGSGSTGYKVFAVVNTALASQAYSDLSVSMTIPDTWGNAEMPTFVNLSINVTAYAVQTVGFESTGAIGALAAAFPAVWGNYPTTANQ